VEGDVRLVPLEDTAVATGECDDVHFGGVELFFQGRWGRICSLSRFLLNRAAEFTLDAQVICRQLGFPFGSVMDQTDLIFEEREVEGVIVWASEVQNRQAYIHVPLPARSATCFHRLQNV